MNRLETELQRLYAAAPAGAVEAAVPGVEGDAHVAAGQADLAGPLLTADGQARALVLELARPADWALLSRVWQGVQAELGWPAPAIAVSGRDGLQLWFSLVQPLPAAQGQALLQALRERFLPGVREQRVSCWPMPAGPDGGPQQAPRVPAPQQADGPWSAFVAPDLAPMFADEPWLDLPPNPDGQAELLARLKSLPPAELAQGLAQLQPVAVANAAAAEEAGGPSPWAGAPDTRAAAVPTVSPAPPALGPDGLGDGPWTDPQAFLLAVMNHREVGLSLRIEAAKALLAHRAPPPQG